MKSKVSTRSFTRTSQLPRALPIAWMDPMSWRLPSGQALAEFALQSGFLAPLLLGGPAGKRKRLVPIPITVKSLSDKRGSDTPGTFRQTR